MRHSTFSEHTLPDNSNGHPPSGCAWPAEHPHAAPRSHAKRIAASFGIQYVDPPAGGPQKNPAPRTAG
ncbi:hypothetical protein [Streptomyces sp. MMBL 11-1]|uniref:hypothetical protein n=1 Tax=Streptomyces sp. MMBL 11-1 TaxID=3026420 RepID=UPI0023612B21|nr:hypothetical protein [Streptomyces sp. MMBL 11-1]